MRLSIFIALVAVLFAQMWYRGGQIKRLNALQSEFALVDRLGEMEKMLKTRERMEALRNGETVDLQAVNPMKIDGFAMQSGVPSVLVDGTVYSEGSAFGEYVIVKITKDMVTLENKKTKAIKNLYVFEQ